jgi:hypothetical protein
MILGLSLVPRLYGLDDPRGSFSAASEEGIRSEQLLLMANGFRPFREIYTNQGPLLLDVLYPFYALFGGSLGAIRLGVGLLSMLGLIGAWWAARQAAGPVGGLAAALLLGASPAYLEGSRLALAQVPSLAPCICAIGCGLRWSASGRDGRSAWLYLAAVLATVGVLIQPMALAVAAPLAVLALAQPTLRLRPAAISLGLALGIAALVVLAIGPADVYRQILQDRLGAGQGASWDLRRSLQLVAADSFHAQPALFILAAGGACLLIVANWRRGLALASWVLAAGGMLLVSSPLDPQDLVYLYAPLTLVAGAGLGRLARMAWKEAPTGRRTRLLTVGLAAILAAVPPAWSATGRSEQPQGDNQLDDPGLHAFDRDALQSIDLLTGPHEFILTDQPGIAALARRMVPPELVDPSRGRTRGEALTDSMAIDAAERYGTRLVLIWGDQLRRLPGIPAWLAENYVLSQVFGARSVKNQRSAEDHSVYLRRGTDLAAARASLEGALTIRETADFEGKLRLLGATISPDSVDTQGQISLTVGWLALAPMSTDYHLSVELVGPNGEVRHRQEHDLEGSARGTSGWEPGRWLFRTFVLRPDQRSPAGDYRIRISVVDPKGDKSLTPSPAPEAVNFRKGDRGGLILGTVHLR